MPIPRLSRRTLTRGKVRRLGPTGDFYQLQPAVGQLLDVSYRDSGRLHGHAQTNQAANLPDESATSLAVLEHPVRQRHEVGELAQLEAHRIRVGSLLGHGYPFACIAAMYAALAMPRAFAKLGFGGMVIASAGRPGKI